MAIVDRRRRDRLLRRWVVGSAVAAAAVVATVVVVTGHIDDGVVDVVPAGPGIATDRTATDDPTATDSDGGSAPTSGPQDAEAGTEQTEGGLAHVPIVDVLPTEQLAPGFIAQACEQATTAGGEDLAAAAAGLAELWQLTDPCLARAVYLTTEQGSLIGVEGSEGAQLMLDLFDDQGFTDEDAAELAAGWGTTDERAVRILGAQLAYAAGRSG